ncbi:bacA, partial [Symbiodinium necroappetens]
MPLSMAATDPQNGKLAAWVPDEPQAEGVEDLFEVITLANEAAVMECESAQFIVKAGTDQTATDGTICRIAVVTEPTQHLWKLHVSLSHAVADSQTLYMVYRMLDERAEVRPLEVERVSFNPVTCLGQVPFHGKWLFFIVRRFGFFLTGLFKDTRQARPVIRVRYVREEWLREQKSKHIAEVDAMYVSSSDLLTSWFLSVTQPACGVMAMDMRDRMPGLGKAHAGVYTTLLMFYPEEYKSAANIRRSWFKLAFRIRTLAMCTVSGEELPPGPLGEALQGCKQQKMILIPIDERRVEDEDGRSLHLFALAAFVLESAFVSERPLSSASASTDLFPAAHLPRYHQLLDQRAQQDPAPGRSLSKAALRCGDESYDDSDLQHLSNGVASLLRVFECKVIAAHMEDDNIFLAPLLLGVQKANAILLPLRTSWDGAKVERMLQESSASLVVTGDLPTMSRYNLSCPVTVLSASEMEATALSLARQGGLVIEQATQHECYYADGGAGGGTVPVSHQMFVNHCNRMIKDFAIGADARAIYCSDGIDTFINEVFPVLMAGGCVDILPEDGQAKQAALARAMSEGSVTHMAGNESRLDSIKSVLAGSIRISAGKVHHLLGPTVHMLRGDRCSLKRSEAYGTSTVEALYAPHEGDE